MINEFLNDYLSIMIFFFIALGLSVGFIILNFLFSPRNPDAEKLSAYECGFEAFDDSRMEFDVRFYLVAILFIIFISLGNLTWKYWNIRFLVNDDFSFCFNCRFYL